MENKGPFLRDSNSTSKIMNNLVIALIPLILFSVYKNGYIPFSKGYTSFFNIFYPLIFVLIGSLSSYAFELIYGFLFKRKKFKSVLLNGYGYIPGLILAMILPINTPLPILILGCLFASIIGKMLYGGFGNNIFNPALIGYIIVVTCFASTLSQCYLNPYEVDAITSSTPLTNLKVVDSITYSNVVGKYGNLYDFFLGTIPGSLCETSAMLCLLSLAYLIIKKNVKYKISLCYIFTVFLMTLFIGLINGIGVWYPLFEILSGGLFFGAIFMATDPVTSPVTSKGQILYGISLGILTVIFRYLTSAPEGVMLAILTMNLLVFIIDKLGLKNKKFIISLIVLVLLGTGISYYISSTLSTDSKDNNYSVISSVKENSKVTYTVYEKGNGGNIKAKIVFDNNKIVSIDILENNETEAYYKKVTDSNYIEKLINEQNNISEVDTVSGATISSTALKKMVINTIQDYGDKYEK